jgi:DNA repair exonuclease SbcCD nuclease subunit
MTEQEDVLLEPAEMPAYDYVALGHIHKAQLLGAPHIRYSGSIERMDRGEQGDEKIALLVELTRRGLQDVKELPLNATPFAHVAVASEQEMAQAAGRIPDLDRTLVSVTATLRREQSLASMIASARRLFPRLYSSVEVKWSGDEERGSPEVRLDRRDVASNVRSYLSQQLDGDPDLEPLTVLAEELLVETGLSEA